MGQYALFINDLTIKTQNNSGVIVVPNNTDQDISGRWNTSI